MSPSLGLDALVFVWEGLGQERPHLDPGGRDNRTETADGEGQFCCGCGIIAVRTIEGLEQGFEALLTFDSQSARHDGRGGANSRLRGGRLSGSAVGVYVYLRVVEKGLLALMHD